MVRVRGVARVLAVIGLAAGLAIVVVWQMCPGNLVSDDQFAAMNELPSLRKPERLVGVVVVDFPR